MEKNKSFFIDVIKLLPNACDCYIQAPSLDDAIILAISHSTKFEYYRNIKLSGKSREILIHQIKTTDILIYFQNVQIKLDDRLLFEGYDGFDYGTISNSIELPQYFIENYVKDDYCLVSTDW